MYRIEKSESPSGMISILENSANLVLLDFNLGDVRFY